ncbi:MAG: hypothetical protein ACO3MV_02010 [Flavobacteriales bacterium]
MDKEKPIAIQRPNYFIEFLVVFLGVTISFWLSEWNDGRKLEELHKEDVVSLLEDLERDRLRLEAVYESAEKGAARSKRVIEVTESYRYGELGYEAFTDSLISIGYIYGYSTFFMNSATYKSLIGSARMQEFPHQINKQIRDYYEYVSKRVEDNNDIVDAIALRYYNEFHPYCLLVNIEGRDHNAEDRAFFDDPENAAHYSSSPFYHQTIALYDRAEVDKRQIGQYRAIRDSLDGMLRGYAQTLLNDKDLVK